jgi:hypothetical protein
MKLSWVLLSFWITLKYYDAKFLKNNNNIFKKLFKKKKKNPAPTDHPTG